MTQYRICNVCGDEHELEDFHRDATMPLGRRLTCGVCAVKAAKRSEEAADKRTCGLSRVYKMLFAKCYAPSHKSYGSHGAQGIVLCDEWLLDKGVFYAWGIRNGWRRGMVVLRHDQDADFSPENCYLMDPREAMLSRPRVKIRQPEVETIRSLLRQGFTQAKVAALFDVSKSCIGSIHRRETWKDV
jgi:hypothetical protein